MPPASHVNLGPGAAVPNQVTVPLDIGRTVSLFNGNGTVHLIVDVVGSVSSDAIVTIGGVMSPTAPLGASARFW